MAVYALNCTVGVAQYPTSTAKDRKYTNGSITASITPGTGADKEAASILVAL